MSDPRAAGRKWAFVAAAVGAVLVAAFVPSGLWVTRSSSACTGCHEPGTHALSAGHEGVSCQSCHPVRAGAGLRLVVLRSGPPHGKASAAACTACHDARDAKWVRIAATDGHRKHEGAERAPEPAPKKPGEHGEGAKEHGEGAAPRGEPVDCLSCHAKSSHGKQPTAEACVGCHEDARVHDKEVEGAAPQCLACHGFSVSHPSLTPEACGACHAPGAKQPAGALEASAIDPTTLHGGVDCKLCHQPHRELPSKRPCKGCHQIQILSGNPNLPPEHLECEKCHVQHKPLAQAGSQCVNCHEQAKAHSAADGGRGPDKRESTALRHDECASCHLPHSWKAAPNDCVTCHAKEATLVRTKSPDRHQRCINCHEVHGAPPSGATCTQCHKENANKMLASHAPAEHKACIGCHKPHAPKLTVPQGCAECHKQELHQVVSLGPADHVKEGCASCHALHGDPVATTKTCVSCHKNQGASVARVSLVKHQQCASCHVAHKFTFEPKNPSCSLVCHKDIAPNQGTHAAVCTKCHAPHASPAVSKEKCVGCHEKIHLKAPANAADHAKCSSCHKPHTAAKEARLKCVSCHEEKAKIAQVWPERSAHRDTCHECHKPHDVGTKNVASCGECHQKEFTSATGGRHACKDCHAPHKTPATDKKGWWNRCVGCHAKEVEASKRHNQCQNCHKPHKFGVPDCKSCHAEEAGKAAHLVKDHQVCTKCHDAHSATLPTRQQCLACHEKQVNHEPQAPACYSCHPFKTQ